MSIEPALYEAASADLSNLSERRTRSVQDFTKPGPDNWTHETVYEFKDGERVTLEGSSVNSLVFAAIPGYERLLFTRPDDAEPETFDIAANIKRMPVIGWEIRRYSCESGIDPITPDWDGTRTSNEAWGIQTPDGLIYWQYKSWNGDNYSRYNDPYSTLDGWIEAIRADWRRMLDEAAEQKKPCPTCGTKQSDKFDDYDLPF